MPFPGREATIDNSWELGKSGDASEQSYRLKINKV